MDVYNVWCKLATGSVWSKTGHTVNGRTDKEAQSRVARKFANAHFSNMSLVAVLEGDTPS